MKALFAICMIVTSTFVWAGESPAAANSVKGEVLEVRQVESYTYLRLKTKDGETWAAVAKASVKKGATVSIENVSVMNNFESKTLNMTFPTILFGALGLAQNTVPNARVIGSDFLPAQTNRTEAAADAHVSKASGANAHTVAEIMSKSAQLKDQTVLVSGKVVKYNAQIMGKNWIHLRDGSGSAADNSNDILVTTKNQANIGDVVTIKGVVRTNKDFGAGYSYRVLIEDATLL